jgi:hypothetical protein
MAKQRPKKFDHLITTDASALDSRSKSGVWFAESRIFKKKQAAILDRLKDETAWLDLKKAILIIDPERSGIVVIAPNPTLPGMIILADGTTPANTEKLLKDFDSLVRRLAEELSISTEPQGSEGPSS